MLYKFDCTAKKTGIMRYNVYSKDGEIIESLNIKEYLVEMKYVNPDSVGEQFLKVFCEGK